MSYIENIEISTLIWLVILAVMFHAFSVCKIYITYLSAETDLFSHSQVIS